MPLASWMRRPGLTWFCQSQPEPEVTERFVTGRTRRAELQAKFVEADEHSLTLDWNGKISKLPMAMFSEASVNWQPATAIESSEEAKAPESVEWI